MVLMIPLLISPSTVTGQFSEETLNVLVEFEYPKSMAGLKDDIQNKLYSNFTDIESDFINNANFTNSTSYTIPLDEMIFDLGQINSTTYLYQISPQIWYTGDTPLNSTELDEHYDLTVADIRSVIIDFLLNNNGTHVMSWLEYKDNEVVLDELF